MKQFIYFQAFKSEVEVNYVYVLYIIKINCLSIILLQNSYILGIDKCFSIRYTQTSNEY